MSSADTIWRELFLGAADLFGVLPGLVGWEGKIEIEMSEKMPKNG